MTEIQITIPYTTLLKKVITSPLLITQYYEWSGGELLRSDVEMTADI